MLTDQRDLSIRSRASRRAPASPCVFVRLTACDLRCSWCDTPYAFHEGRKMSVDEVVAAVERHRLAARRDHRRRAAAAGRCLPADGSVCWPRAARVMLETGGHRSDRLACPRAVVKIVDVKCPGQRRSRTRTTGSNLDRLAPHDEVKFVVRIAPTTSSRATSSHRYDLPSRVAAVSDVAGARRARSEDACRSGCSPIGCRRGCSCSCTNTSGRPTHERRLNG